MKTFVLSLLVVSLAACDPIAIRTPAATPPAVGHVADAGSPVVESAAASCVLGRTLDELVSDDARVVQTDRLDASSYWPEDLLAQALAFGRASGVVATRASELLAGLGVVTLERTTVYDRPSARSFVAFARPDRSEGLVFAERSERVVARIVDGAFTSCAAPRARCHVGTTERDFLDEPRLVTLADRTLTAATPPDPVDLGRMLVAVRVARPEVASAEAAFASVDAGEVRRVVRREPATSRVFTMFVYGAGDNAYGAVFEDGDVPVVEIHDGDFYGCTALDSPWSFAPAPP